MSTRKETAEKVLRSLRLNLVLSMVLPLMLFSGVAIYAGLTAVEENFNDRLREDLELVSRAVSGPLSRAMSEGDELVLGESLKSLFRIGRVYGASVFDSEGRQIASLGVADSDVAGSASAGKAIASGELGGAFRRVDGVAVFSQFTPLIAEGGRIQGLLQITRKRSDFHELIASTRLWAVIIWFSLSLIVVLVVVLGHYGAVGRHVNRLLAVMESMGPGHWEVRESSSGPAEIRRIHKGLERMGYRMASDEQEISERIARERELADQLRYQEKVAMIGRVAGGVAHELGAPLNVIQGRAGRLRRMGVADDQVRHLDDIEVQVERMTRIIRQLLDCFRHVPDARRETSLSDRVRELWPTLTEDRRCASVELVLGFVPDAAMIMAEPIRLETAVVNVIRNACQAARGRVEVNVEKTGNFWILHVDDDGPGIDPELREQIFEPFFSTRPAGEGTGLGLAVVGSVIKEHQGQLEVGESHLGGCRMSLYWPVAGVESEEQLE
ncbi:MAG: ATP-binding protein [Pseudomonadota bacterium]|nr:ATP-binding protein [Pseudomonadota bacterium]